MITAKIEFGELSERLQTIEKLIREFHPSNEDKWIRNDELCQLLDISHKTAQSYRDRGLIRFSQIGNKIHYRMSEVNKFLENNSKGGFSGKGNK